MGEKADRRQVELILTDRARELVPRIRDARQPLLDWGRATLDGQGLRVATATLGQLLDQNANSGQPERTR